MSNIDKIRQEIERRKKENMYNELPITVGRYYEDRDLLSFLDTLPEQPVEGLKEAACDYLDNHKPLTRYNWGDLMDAFIAGAEWQKKQMGEQARKELAKTDITLADLVAFDEGCKIGRRLERQDLLKDAVEGYVNYYEDSGGILMAEAQVGCPYHNGDKVKIVIVKEEE